MSEALEKKVRDLLNEEKWTRAAITNYSVNNFKEFDVLIEQAKKEHYFDELKELCDTHLSHTKTSITALYISSIISLSKQLLDDSALVSLLNIFTDNHKIQVVEYLCLRVLEFGDSKLALRTLASCYKETGNENIYDIWERLVRVDYEEADLAKQLGEYYEQNGDTEKAVEFYKKALYRFINRKHINFVKEVWLRLVELVPQEIEFFYHVQRKVNERLGAERSALLMQDLYSYYKKEQDWDTAIDILKLILACDDKDIWTRKEITECFREKYQGHSQLEEYIKVSNLTQSWRNVFEAIDDFEKHIAFDEGNFVFHRTWGVGRIAKVDRDDLVIDFAKKRNHTMSLKMGITALKTLDKEHIWVLKATVKPAELSAKIKNDPEWALKTVIRSFDNNCDFKHIKQELVPSLLKPSEWTSWNTKARKIVKENPEFGVNPSNIDFYTVHGRPISVEEKLTNEFKAQKNFFERIDILFNVLDKGNTDSDGFQEMFSYFDSFLKAFNQVNEQVIASYLVAARLKSVLPHLTTTKQHTFCELFEQIENPAALYTEIKNKELKSAYLNHIKNLVPHWEDHYIKLFPVVLSNEVLTPLLNAYPEKVNELVLTCFREYKDYREAVIWFFKNVQEEQWFKDLNISYELQIIALIHILDITYREIANRRNTTENRKINKQILTILFGPDALLENFIVEHTEDTVTRLYTLIADIKDLDPAKKMELRNRILERYKNFKFPDEEEKTTTERGLIVTAKMMDEKKKELQRLIDEELPRNARDIAYALSLGDLRENAEYKAAREEQSRLNNTISRLQEELDRAQIFDPSTISTARVGFGTVVLLENGTTKNQEKYTILGPWESDPENGIISYMSPLGTHLLSHKVGEVLSFIISEEEKVYKVLEISPADI